MSKTIVITGSTSGLGREAARRSLEAGANVVISSESQSALHQTLEEFEQYRDRVSGVVCDVTDLSQVKGLRDFALTYEAKIDCWINNAGITAPSGASASVPFEHGQQVIDVNITGTYHGAVVAVRQFHKQGYGRLINITGRGEKGPQPDANLYSSAKAWVRNFTLAMAKEEASDKVQIGTFNPGLILTGLTSRPRILEGYEAKMLKGLKMVMPVIGDTPEKAASVLAALATGELPLKRENRARAFLPFVFKRFLTGRRADIDVNDIHPVLVPREDE